VSDGAIPAHPLPLAARAPGKVVVFGEHSVVHGGPELLFAIDLFVQVGARGHASTRLNSDAQAPERNPYLREALARLWADGPPVDLTSTSQIPRSAGLGSSGAFASALAALFGAVTGGVERARLAELAFGIERGAQGVGSPGDTSAVTAGGFVSVNAGLGERLWTLSDGTHTWEVRRVAAPAWSWVVAYSGVPRSTGLTVSAVGRRLKEPDGPALLERFRRVTLDGIDAVVREERERAGALLAENHALLREVGVSHPRLEQLIEAAMPVCEGAKLTGAGAGGSILALPKMGRELECARRIARSGGVPYIVRPAAQGTALVPDA
jgi:mevalonate kinase